MNLTVLQDMGVSKTSISQKAKSFINDVIEAGTVLQAAETLSAAEKFIKEVKDSKQFKESVRTEIEKYGKAAPTINGTTIELAETGTKYDYAQTGDVLLQQLEQKAESANNALKERQEFLKAIPISGIDCINEDTGEVYHIYPPSKSSTSSYKVTLK